ncbi:site-specific DNA-methyltransferase [Frankia sp. CNm7]|uniref:Methyltransferase n=1 Tax=Frankia nepalensis TaxID=1836974 RepID=A0A937RJU5_9ACTN|nr:site-specific DNA-methyltransferase [Frankia nepalensis]MBL7496180.1 site-specific DNA-methyltransferase [Frankia nepalensis]MBL7511590.1 site-specific DNA-methyltransferase [Frankia nepalensis]MBL7520640.1 site-specific DNA-methyltransferase [Frankia nepalensis]MBL7630265.1 site-specific DNA-methyltransferase [Frankia nepalensis]
MTSPLPPPYHQSPGVTLYTGDAHDVLAGFPSASVDCVVTSPPYWRQRDYGTRQWTGGDPGCRHRAASRRTAGPRLAVARCRSCAAVQEDRQYGQESTPDAYITALRRVFGELARVLIPTGTVWLNLGDTYASRLPPVAVPAAPTGTAVIPLRRRNLLGLPWHVAFGLQADGWIVRNAIVWWKKNAMPEPVTDRFSTRYELLFLLVREQRHYLDLDAIHAHRTALEPSSQNQAARVESTDAQARLVGPAPRRRPRATGGADRTERDAAGELLSDVWAINTRPLAEPHFATYPIDLPLRCIAAGCPPYGTVLDPFSGTATTGLAARALNRPYVGIDLNPAFHDIAIARLARAPDQARAAVPPADAA